MHARFVAAQQEEADAGGPGEAPGRDAGRQPRRDVERGGRAAEAGAGAGRGSRPLGGRSRTSCCRSWRASRPASATSARRWRRPTISSSGSRPPSKQLEQRRIAARVRREAHRRVRGARSASCAQMTDEIDNKIHNVTQREAIVEAVRKEVDGRPRDQRAQQVRSAVRRGAPQRRRRAARDGGRVCSARSARPRRRLAQIESRKKLVDEVQLKTNVIANMLEDVRLNLETLGEQKARHGSRDGRTSTGSSEMVQEAQTTLRSLQTERELAERIERGIKQLARRRPGKTRSERRKTAASSDPDVECGSWISWKLSTASPRPSS